MSQERQQRIYASRGGQLTLPILWRYCCGAGHPIVGPGFAVKLRPSSRLTGPLVKPGIRKMSKLIGLLYAVALFGIAQGVARAEDHACTFAEWGYSYYRIEHQGEAWTYLLTASGPNWQNIPYGYHAPGFLVCESCSSVGKEWGGLYHFGDHANLRLATAAERVALRKEWVGYPPVPLGPEDLEQYGSREGITMGPLTGYAVLYRFVAREVRNKPSWADHLGGREGGLLVIDLTDGCVSFETTILLQWRADRDPWAPLDSLLTEVTIEKSSGAREGPRPPPGTGYSAIVRPRRQDE
jgi:hypothetical protein